METTKDNAVCEYLNGLKWDGLGADRASSSGRAE
jgi:hypothetical protein